MRYGLTLLLSASIAGCANAQPAAPPTMSSLEELLRRLPACNNTESEGVLDPAMAARDAAAAFARGDRQFLGIRGYSVTIPGVDLPFTVNPDNSVTLSEPEAFARRMGIRVLKGTSDMTTCALPSDYGAYAEAYNLRLYKLETGKDVVRPPPLGPIKVDFQSDQPLGLPPCPLEQSEGLLDPAKAEFDARQAFDHMDQRFLAVSGYSSWYPGVERIGGIVIRSDPVDARSHEEMRAFIQRYGSRVLKGPGDNITCSNPGDYGTYAAIYNIALYRRITGRDPVVPKLPETVELFELKQ